MKCRFTRHAIERFVQRSNKCFKHLDECRKQECESCNRLKREIQEYITQDEQQINRLIVYHITHGKKDRSYLNNTNFMDFYYEKYGYNFKCDFIVSQYLVFIIVKTRTPKLVTVLNRKLHYLW